MAVLPAGSRVLAEDVDLLDQIQAPHQWRLNATTESVSNATDTKLTFTTTVSSTGVTVGSVERITIALAGRYQVSASVRWPGGGTAGRELFCTVRRYNSSNVLQQVLGGSSLASTSTGNGQNSVSGSIICAAGDYLEVWVYQNSGGSKTPENNPSVSSGGTMFEGYWAAEA